MEVVVLDRLDGDGVGESSNEAFSSSGLEEEQVSMWDSWDFRFLMLLLLLVPVMFILFFLAIAFATVDAFNSNDEAVPCRSCPLPPLLSTLLLTLSSSDIVAEAEVDADDDDS